MKNRLYDATKIDWDNLMFSTKELWMLLIPIMVEQMLNSLMGMADTMMVSNVGSVAMSAVSLVDSINTLVIQVFAALATGAAIICSHYLGKGDERGANKAARQIFLTVIVISLTITAGGLIFCRPLLRLIFGAVEPAVMEDSIIYFLITASSYRLLPCLMQEEPFTVQAETPNSRENIDHFECVEYHWKCSPYLRM